MWEMQILHCKWLLWACALASTRSPSLASLICAWKREPWRCDSCLAVDGRGLARAEPLSVMVMCDTQWLRTNRRRSRISSAWPIISLNVWTTATIFYSTRGYGRYPYSVLICVALIWIKSVVFNIIVGVAEQIICCTLKSVMQRNWS